MTWGFRYWVLDIGLDGNTGNAPENDGYSGLSLPNGAILTHFAIGAKLRRRPLQTRFDKSAFPWYNAPQQLNSPGLLSREVEGPAL